MGETAVTSEETPEREFLLRGKHTRGNGNESCRQDVAVHGIPPSTQPESPRHYRATRTRHQSRATTVRPDLQKRSRAGNLARWLPIGAAERSVRVSVPVRRA